MWFSSSLLQERENRVYLFCAIYFTRFVYVSAAPYFEREPLTHVRAAKGGRVKFRCKVQGKPRPFLLWYRDSELVSTVTNKRYGRSLT